MRDEKDGIQSLELEITWRAPSAPDLSFLPLTSRDIVDVLLSLQLAFEEVSSILGLPPSSLYIESIKHPNTSLKVSGLAESIKALKLLIEYIPAFIVSLCVIPAKVRQKTQEIELNTEVICMLKEGLTAYRSAPDPKKEIYLREFLRHATRNCTEPIHSAPSIALSQGNNPGHDTSPPLALGRAEESDAKHEKVQFDPIDWGKQD